MRMLKTCLGLAALALCAPITASATSTDTMTTAATELINSPITTADTNDLMLENTTPAAGLGDNARCVVTYSALTTIDDARRPDRGTHDPTDALGSSEAMETTMTAGAGLDYDLASSAAATEHIERS